MRGVEAKQSFQPVFQEAAANVQTKARNTSMGDASHPTSIVPGDTILYQDPAAPDQARRAPVHDQPQQDEAASTDDQSDSHSSSTRTETQERTAPVEPDYQKRVSTGGTNSAGLAGTQPVEIDGHPDSLALDLRLSDLRSLDVETNSSTIADATPATGEPNAPNPPISKPDDPVIVQASQEPGQSQSPGSLVFQLSFQVPGAATTDESAAGDEFKVSNETGSHDSGGGNRSQEIPTIKPLASPVLPNVDLRLAGLRSLDTRANSWTTGMSRSSPGEDVAAKVPVFKVVPSGPTESSPSQLSFQSSGAEEPPLGDAGSMSADESLEATPNELAPAGEFDWPHPTGSHHSDPGDPSADVSTAKVAAIEAFSDSSNPSSPVTSGLSSIPTIGALVPAQFSSPMPASQLIPARPSQPAQPSPRLPDEPAVPAPAGTPVRKMGVLIRATGDQVVRLQISQSNGSVTVAAHSDDETLGEHLRASLPDLVDRLGRQGYAPATSSPAPGTGVPISNSALKDLKSGFEGDPTEGQQPGQQRQRSRNAWQALASKLHDS